MESFSIGPFAFSVVTAAAAGTLIMSSLGGDRAARPLKTNFAPAFWSVVIAAVGSARAVFVAKHWTQFAPVSWNILDIRDGGLNVAAGVAVGVIVAIALGYFRPVLRKPLAVSVLTGAVSWAVAAGMMDLLEGTTGVPGAELTDLRGNAVRLSAFVGKPMVVNMWATWCPPCRREMPVLRDAQQANPDITFVFADQGQSADEVNEFLQSQGLVVRNVVLDRHGALAAAAGSEGLPTTLFYDAAGKFVKARVGALSAATLADMLDAIRAAPGVRQPR